MVFCRKCYGAMQQRYFQLWLNGGRSDFLGQRVLRSPTTHQILVIEEKSTAARENT